MRRGKYECEACGEHVSLNAYVVSRWDMDTGDRCTWCGTTYHVKQGQATRISPLMLPVDVGVRLSPWYDAKYHPAVRGLYECRYREIEPAVVRLRWNGIVWEFEGAQVVGSMLAWRGSWE